jgi:hypothetical protein
VSEPRQPGLPPAGDSPVRYTDLSTNSASTSRRSVSASSTPRTGRAAAVRTDGSRAGTEGFTPDILAVQSRLTSRDRTVIDWLDRHGVLTTAQITAALFTSPVTASHRLAKLRAMGLVDRFHHPFPTGGFGPWHWVIDLLGARIAGAGRDAKPLTAGTLRARYDRLTDSVRLPHLLGTNQFFIDLHAHARQHPETRLVRWWSERETAQRYGGRLHPDGHALWRDNNIVIGLFLEYDRGTERLWRLVKKIDAFDQIAREGGPAYPVLFSLDSAQRETELHDEFARRHPHGPVPVATTVRDPNGPGPAGPVWALVGDDNRLRTLAELPSHHGNPDATMATKPNLDDSTLDQEL